MNVKELNELFPRYALVNERLHHVVDSLRPGFQPHVHQILRKPHEPPEPDMVTLFWHSHAQRPLVHELGQPWQDAGDVDGREAGVVDLDVAEEIPVFRQVAEGTAKGNIGDDIKGEELGLLREVYGPE